jgi:hypothetical protein
MRDGVAPLRRIAPTPHAVAELEMLDERTR